MLEEIASQEVHTRDIAEDLGVPGFPDYPEYRNCRRVDKRAGRVERVADRLHRLNWGGQRCPAAEEPCPEGGETRAGSK